MTHDAPPLGGWTPPATPPTGSAAVAAAAGGLATWLPDGRWTTPSEPPPRPARDGGVRLRRSAGLLERARGPGQGGRDRELARRRLAVVRALARLSGWPRRVAAALLALLAVVLMVGQDPPAAAVAPAATTPVVVVARDLAAGTTLTRAYVRTVDLPTAAVPVGTARDVRSVAGRVLAGSVRRGEPLTDARLLGPGLTAGLDATESTAVPVRLADPETVSLVRAGDRVDVLGTPVQPDGGPSPAAEAVTLATAVRVLAVLRAQDAADGAVLVVAAAPPVGRRLAGAAAGHRLTVAVRPP